MLNKTNFEWEPYLIQSGLSILIAVIVLKILGKLINVGLEKISHGKRLETLASVAKTSLKFLAFIVVIFIMVNPFIDLTKILAGAGVLGIVLGFGAQSIIKDMLTGFFFLFENQIHKGDTITINNNYTGTVEEVGFRALKIREYSGKLLSISNGNIVEILNGNVERRRIVEGIKISADENPREVIEKLEELCVYLTEIYVGELIRDEEGRIIEPFHVRGVDNLSRSENGITYNIVASVYDETYFTTMYGVRKHMVQCAYDNAWKFSEQRIRLIDKDEHLERLNTIDGHDIQYCSERIVAFDGNYTGNEQMHLKNKPGYLYDKTKHATIPESKTIEE